jgi:hypothetical protein
MMLKEEYDKPEIIECIHAHYIETNPYSHDSDLIFIPVCNQCYIDYEIEGIEVRSIRRIHEELCE